MSKIENLSNAANQTAGYLSGNSSLSTRLGIGATIFGAIGRDSDHALYGVADSDTLDPTRNPTVLPAGTV